MKLCVVKEQRSEIMSVDVAAEYLRELPPILVAPPRWGAQYDVPLEQHETCTTILGAHTIHGTRNTRYARRSLTTHNFNDGR